MSPFLSVVQAIAGFEFPVRLCQCAFPVISKDGSLGPKNTIIMLIIGNGLAQAALSDPMFPTATKIGLTVFSLYGNSLCGIAYHHKWPPRNCECNGLVGILLGGTVVLIAGNTYFTTLRTAATVGSIAAFSYNYFQYKYFL